MPRLSKLVLLFFTLTLFIGYFTSVTQESKATISSCSATVNPESGQPGSTDVRFDFTITNNDSGNTIRWFKITKPYSGVTIKILGLFGWSKNIEGDSAVYTGGTITPGSSASPYITVDIANVSGSGNWVIQVSDDAGGLNPVNCSGSLGLTVTLSGQDSTPPSISNLTISNITSTSATISWNTDEPASSLVKYDVHAGYDAYPFSQGNSGFSTSHNIVVSASIAPNTTYYYRVCSSDEAGNETCTTENSFTTAKLATTVTPTSTATPVTVIVTATPVPGIGTSVVLPPSDRIPPRVTIATDLSGAFETAPLVKGSATDNTGVHHVDYSTDGGNNWLPVDVLETTGGKQVTFEFTPLIYEDGNYEIRVRALDAAGNIGLSEVKTLVIDRLPPRVGGNLLSMGPLALLPNSEGTIVTMAGLEQRITLSAVGGPVTIDLFVGEKMSSLSFSAETGLWTGAINIDKPGLYQLKTKAVDGAENKTERDLNKILVLPPGQITDFESRKIINKGEVTLYVKDELTGFWSVWDGETFSQSNPQNISEEGNYQYYLPSGTYYLTLKIPGKGKMTSKIFTLVKTTPFNADFVFKPGKSIKLGPILIPLPAFLSEKAEVVLETQTSDIEQVSVMQGEEMPGFVLAATSGEFDSKSLSGQVSVISFINTWSPPALEQLVLLDSLASEADVSLAVVTPQEAYSKISVFQRRGNYRLPIIVDRDGELVESFKLTSLPAHFFVDRKGVIKRVVTAVLSPQEIRDILLEIR